MDGFIKIQMTSTRLSSSICIAGETELQISIQFSCLCVYVLTIISQ